MDEHGFTQPKPVLDICEEDETLKLRMTSLKREETENLAKIERLNMERDTFLVEARRIKDEDLSRFKDHPVLAERYLLMQLIGKGGFSEVFKVGFATDRRKGD